MNFSVGIIFVLFGFFSQAAGPSSNSVAQSLAENRAVEVQFMGGFTGFDPEAYQVLRSSIAYLIAEGVIDHFITTAWGREGGHNFCIQLNQDPNFTLEPIIKMLSAIHPGNNTIYSYKEVPTCLPESK